MFVCVVCVFGVCVGLFVWYMHVCEFITPLCVVCMCVCVFSPVYVCMSVLVCAYGVQRAMLNVFFYHSPALKNILLGIGGAHL